MSVIRPTRHRIVLGLLATIGTAITACEAAPTAPSRGPLSRLEIAARALEGDSTTCSRGFIIVNGVIVCNEE